MGKVNLETDDIRTAIVKLADGNPGAATCLVHAVNKVGQVDPDSALGYLGVIMNLDSYEIYGTNIYVLWNDICNRSTVKFLALLRAVQLGLLNCAVLKDASNRQDYSGRNLIDADDILVKVKERLPNFGKGDFED